MGVADCPRASERAKEKQTMMCDVQTGWMHAVAEVVAVVGALAVAVSAGGIAARAQNRWKRSTRGQNHQERRRKMARSKGRYRSMDFRSLSAVSSTLFDSRHQAECMLVEALQRCSLRFQCCVAVGNPAAPSFRAALAHPCVCATCNCGSAAPP